MKGWPLPASGTAGNDDAQRTLMFDSAFQHSTSPSRIHDSILSLQANAYLNIYACAYTDGHASVRPCHSHGEGPSMNPLLQRSIAILCKLHGPCLMSSDPYSFEPGLIHFLCPPRLRVVLLPAWTLLELRFTGEMIRTSSETPLQKPNMYPLHTTDRTRIHKTCPTAA